MKGIRNGKRGPRRVSATTRAVFSALQVLALGLALTGLAALPALSQQSVYGPMLLLQLDEQPNAMRPLPVPRPLPPDSHPVIQRELTLTSLKVDVRIRGALAETTLRQTLRNDTGVVQEGRYVVPLPPGAGVSDFAITDGDQRLEARAVPADEARRTYEEIVRQMRDPGLLEFINAQTFSVQVFPFQPGSERTIELRFTQALAGGTDLVAYNLPLRWVSLSRCGEPYGSGAEFLLTYSIASDHPLGTISSPAYKVSVNRESDKRASGSVEQRISYFSNDFTLNIGRRTGDFAAGLMCYPGESGDDGYFMLSLLAAPQADTKAIPKDVLFVFDKSGSMSGDKIEQAKGALRFVLGRLNKEDRFGLTYYSDSVTRVFDELTPASGDNVAKARGEVEKLQADGGTDINSALADGARLLGRGDGKRPRYVIFMTDGLPTVGETDVPRIIDGAKENFAADVKLFVFGVGYDVNTTLLDSLSYAHHGSAEYVTEGEDIEQKVSAFYAKIASPALTGIKLALKGLEIYDLAPRDLPDLFHNTEIFVTGRYRGRPAASVDVSVSGSAQAGSPGSYSARIAPSSGRQNNQVARLWATRKVSWLLDQLRLHGDSKELLGEVDRLATRYGIVTPYTSYLITEPEKYFDLDTRQHSLAGQMQEARDDESGETAVGRSKMSQTNQAHDNAAAPQAAGAAAGGGGGDYLNDLDGRIPDLQPTSRPSGSNAGTNVNYVNDLTFVYKQLDGTDAQGGSRSQWIDSRMEDGQQRIRVASFSDEYFELLNQHPLLGEYLSQGENVVLVLGNGVVLETTDEDVRASSDDLQKLAAAISAAGL